MKNIKHFATVFVIVILSSCSNIDETNQLVNTNLSEQEAFEILQREIILLEKEKEFIEVEQIDGKTATDYYREWQQNGNSRMGTSCSDTPNCPKTTINGVFNFGNGCDIAYSYDLYNCGFGNVGIFNFQMTPVSGSSCLFYDILVTQNYNSGDLMEYQMNYNKIAAIILSDIEDALFNTIPPFGGQTLIASYLPNICSVVCQINGAQEECGEDCCIRFAVYDNNTKSRTTDVFSAGECGGTIVTCSNGQTGDCQNFNCVSLDEYR